MAKQGSFAATVDAWVAETKERMTAVRNIAVEKTVEQMQNPTGKGGALPLDTGFLRASLQAVQGDALPAMTENESPEGRFVYNTASLTSVLATAPLTAPVSIIYTAKYARRMEYGFVGKDSLGREYNQQGFGFVRLAAMNWVKNVEAAAAEVRARAAG